MHVPGDKAAWDESRNTSRTRMPEAGCVDRALKAVAALRLKDPALVEWVEEGHPTLTEEEHERRFGVPWKRDVRSLPASDPGVAADRATSERLPGM